MDLIKTFTDLLPIELPFVVDRLEKDEAKGEAHIYLQVDSSNLPVNSFVHSYYSRSWEHLKLFQYRCFIHCELPIYKDKVTGKLTKSAVSFSRDYSRFTLLYEREVMRLMKIHHCFSTVGKNLGIYPQRVEAIYHHYTESLAEDTITETPVNVAYDETSSRKGHEYITTFQDLDNHKIIGIYDGKASDCVAQFMQDHPYPEALKNISIDMSPAFISGAKHYFSQAEVTFDKWHVIKLIYKHLDTLGTRAEAFNTHISLLMDQITSFYKQNLHAEFTAQLQFIADFAQDMLNDNPITKTIMAHFDGIANYAHSKITNAVMEGINAKIQVIKRVARGFRYKHNFKKMIRFLFAEFNFQVIS